VRTNPRDGDPGDLGGGHGRVRSGEPQGRAGPAEGRAVASSHGPEDARPHTPPVGTGGCIVRDAQFYHAWGLFRLQHIHKSLLSCFKGHLASGSGDLGGRAHPHPVAGRRAQRWTRRRFCHPQASLQGKEPRGSWADAQAVPHSACPPHPPSAPLAADPAPGGQGNLCHPPFRGCYAGSRSQAQGTVNGAGGQDQPVEPCRDPARGQ